MKRFTVTEEVFKTEPLFLLGCSFERLNRELARWKVDAGEDVGQFGSMLTFDRTPWRVVWTAKLDAPVVLHEVFHLVTRICYDRGITIQARDAEGNINDEAAAYLFEYFSRAVLRRLR